MKHLRRYFITGLIIVLPVIATIWLLTFLFSLLPGPKTPEFFINLFGEIKQNWIPVFIFRFLVLIVLFVAITLLGAFATRTIGSKITKFFEKLLERIPLFNRIYKALKQITDALFGHASQVFKKVAVIEYPREGIYTLVFITNESDIFLHEKIHSAFGNGNENNEYINIFLPTTPNPTSGFFLALPKKDVKVLDISIEEALKLIISGGAIKLKELTSEEPNG